MIKLSKAALLISCTLSASSYALTIQPDPQNPTGYIVAKSELAAAEAAKTADPMYKVWQKALETRSNSVVEAIAPGLASNPENVKRVERMFPEKEWNFLTMIAAPEYTYTGFLQAVGKFPAFCGEYTDGRDSDAICKKSIITAFAHFAQETGGHMDKHNTSNVHSLERWQQALVHVREMNHTEASTGYRIGCGQNDWQNKRWPCAPGVGYFGRGAKQLSYHYNYGPFSEAMFDGDATVLLNNPALVADTWLNMASAIWFFLTPQAPKPAMLHVIDRTWIPSPKEVEAGIGYGFGTTINVINGGLECGAHNKTKGQPVNRISYWRDLAKHYQIPVERDEIDTCWQQLPFGSLNLQGADNVLYTNWEADWSNVAANPSGASFKCKLVGYQTAYSALVPGDYEKCVTNLYGSHSNWPEVRAVDKLPATGTGPFTQPGTNPVQKPDTGSTTANGIITWVAGKTEVNAGDVVEFGGKCFKATHKPGIWETPKASSWFWEAAACPAEQVQPVVKPVPAPVVKPVPAPVVKPEPAPVTKPEPTTVVKPEPAPVTKPEPAQQNLIHWVTGVTKVANGDKVISAGKCFVARNSPSEWEGPKANSWFWNEVSCN